MSLIATLVSSRADPQVGDDLVARAVAALGGGARRILAPAVAVDIEVAPGLDAAEAGRRLRETVAGRPVDVALVPAADRRKRLLVADMDSTMIGQECIDELADFAGLRERVAAITERAMRGEIAFEPALRERVALLADLDVRVVGEVLRERIRLTPGGPELVRTMRAHGARTALVSGGFTAFTGPVARAIGFDEDRANVLDVADGRLSGRVTEPILGREAKLDSLRSFAARDGLTLLQTIAVGDGANDLMMVRAAGIGVAYRAKPAVAAQAKVRIDHADLTALLFVQGYAADEIVTADFPGPFQV